METTDSSKGKHTEGKHDCFIIMPISDPDGYAKGHFQHVYEDLVAPACDLAGYKPVRADDVKQTNLIHLDVLQKLIESPMAICDLSSRNPNVLFELGLRQAFDKPVVLIQEVGTPKIFDIAPLRYFEYRKERIYHEVLVDQKGIADALSATRDAKKHSINSIVKLLSITKPASIPEVAETNRDPALQVIRAELSDLRTEIRQLASVAPRRGLENERNERRWISDMRETFREAEYRMSKAQSPDEVKSEVQRMESIFHSLFDRVRDSEKMINELSYMRSKIHAIADENLERTTRSMTEKTLTKDNGSSRSGVLQ
jgi:hypothetical protein